MTQAKTDNAWGLWGAVDERGSLNFIGPDEVRRATGLVKTGEVLRLAQLLSPKTPVPSHRCDDKLYNGYSGDTIRSTSGAAHLGIEKMPPIVTRGVLIDLVKLKRRVMVPGEVVSRADLEAATALTGVVPARGDAVLLRTGWLESQKGVKGVSFDTEPGIDVDAARWLLERDVAMVGADNFAIEVLPFAAETVFPVHQLLIRDYGVPLLEGLMLDPLVDCGRHEFLFMASVLPIVGATGSPLAPVVVL